MARAGQGRLQGKSSSVQPEQVPANPRRLFFLPPVFPCAASLLLAFSQFLMSLSVIFRDQPDSLAAPLLRDPHAPELTSIPAASTLVTSAAYRAFEGVASARDGGIGGCMGRQANGEGERG